MFNDLEYGGKVTIMKFSKLVALEVKTLIFLFYTIIISTFFLIFTITFKNKKLKQSI